MSLKIYARSSQFILAIQMIGMSNTYFGKGEEGEMEVQMEVQVEMEVQVDLQA